MSSEMFPFASHPKYGYDLGYVDTELKEIGALAKKYGHRLTSHPGQFTQIASPKENVVEAAVKELDCEWIIGVDSNDSPSNLGVDHCEMMDRMRLDCDSVMIIHMGVS